MFNERKIDAKHKPCGRVLTGVFHTSNSRSGEYIYFLSDILHSVIGTDGLCQCHGVAYDLNSLEFNQKELILYALMAERQTQKT